MDLNPQRIIQLAAFFFAGEVHISAAMGINIENYYPRHNFMRERERERVQADSQVIINTHLQQQTDQADP
jgi:hypothetical protein